MKVWRPNVVTNIQTPNGLAFALTSQGGLTNSIVQLVDIDRIPMEWLEKMLEPVTEKLKEYISRINYIYYTQSYHYNTFGECLDGIFSFDSMAFSGEGRKLTFE